MVSDDVVVHVCSYNYSTIPELIEIPTASCLKNFRKVVGQ